MHQNTKPLILIHQMSYLNDSLKYLILTQLDYSSLTFKPYITKMQI